MAGPSGSTRPRRSVRADLAAEEIVLRAAAAMGTAAAAAAAGTVTEATAEDKEIAAASGAKVAAVMETVAATEESGADTATAAVLVIVVVVVVATATVAGMETAGRGVTPAPGPKCTRAAVLGLVDPGKAGRKGAVAVAGTAIVPVAHRAVQAARGGPAALLVAVVLQERAAVPDGADRALFAAVLPRAPHRGKATIGATTVESVRTGAPARRRPKPSAVRGTKTS